MADEIPLIPEVPPKLREASASGTLIPFVGAGASRLAGCPDWAGFADGALKAFVDGGKFSYAQLDQIRHLPPRMKLSIAKSLQEEHELPVNYKEIIDPHDGYSNDAGRRLYGALARLGNTFITTNYDGWLDFVPVPLKPSAADGGAQVNATSTPTKRRILYDPNDFTPVNLNSPNTVFHLHGSLLHPPGMITTTRDYIHHYRNDRHSDDPTRENRTLSFLDHLFRHKTVLFVGYGVEELEILEYVIQKGQMQPPRANAEAKHFMLQGFHSHQVELMRSLTRYYKQCDIQLLPFRKDQRDWYQLIDVLAEYASAMPANEVLTLQKMTEMENLFDDE